MLRPQQRVLREKQSRGKTKLTREEQQTINEYQTQNIAGKELLTHNNKIMLPLKPDLFRQIIYEYHDKQQVGHPGFFKTWLMIREHFESPKLKNYVSRYVKGCDLCQRTKIRPPSRYTLNPTEITELPWEQIYVDLLGPLPKD